MSTILQEVHKIQEEGCRKLFAESYSRFLDNFFKNLEKTPYGSVFCSYVSDLISPPREKGIVYGYNSEVINNLLQHIKTSLERDGFHVHIVNTNSCGYAPCEKGADDREELDYLYIVIPRDDGNIPLLEKPYCTICGKIIPVPNIIDKE